MRFAFILSFLVFFSTTEAAQDPLVGARVFGSKGCARCHAIGGVGGTLGPDLGRTTEARSFYQLASSLWNHFPHMLEAMEKLGLEPSPMDPKEAGDLVAFLFLADYFDPPGDAVAGSRLFRDKRCVTCHQLQGTGGVVGPSLDVAAREGPIYLAAALWNHGPTMAEAMAKRGIERPVFTGTELRDLVAYLRSASPPGPPGEELLHVLPGNAEKGRILFDRKGCAGCHAVGAEAKPSAPPLAGKRYPSLLEFAAAMWNKQPAMLRAARERGGGLPSFDAGEMADLVAYLATLGFFAERGDASRGEKLVGTRGCLACHSIGPLGGRSAPDFRSAKGFEDPAGVVAALWNHGSSMARKLREKNIPWPRLEPQDVADLVAFLRELGEEKP
ncbi:MAG: hypothetical protein KatS3mg076_0061 [Candidatus Binatia bacterium]|nr:MAG: hypothetical protein KatS3mg076_0061 [Candidatus Binatia bacterium]